MTSKQRIERSILKVMISAAMACGVAQSQADDCPKRKAISAKGQNIIAGHDLDPTIIEDLSRQGFSHIKPDGSYLNTKTGLNKWHLVYVSFCAKPTSKGCQDNSSFEGVALPNGRAAYLGGVGQSAQNKLKGINATVSFKGETKKNSNTLCYYSFMKKDTPKNQEVSFGISKTELHSGQGWFGDDHLKPQEGKIISEAALPVVPIRPSPPIISGAGKMNQKLPQSTKGKTDHESKNPNLKKSSKSEASLEKPTPSVRLIDCPKQLSESALHSLSFSQNGDYMVRGENPYYIVCLDCAAIKGAGKGNILPEITGQLLNQTPSSDKKGNKCKYNLQSSDKAYNGKGIEVMTSTTSLQAAARKAITSNVSLGTK